MIGAFTQDLFPEYVQLPDLVAVHGSQGTAAYPLHHRLPLFGPWFFASGEFKLPHGVEVHDTCPVPIWLPCLCHILKVCEDRQKEIYLQ